MLRLIYFVILLLLAPSAFGQYFNFSQRYFANERINPSHGTTQDNAFLNIIHRTQDNATDLNLRSNYISLNYPLKYSNRFGNILTAGASILDDRTAPVGIFHTIEYSGFAAVKITITPFEHLSLGMRTSFHHRRFDLNNVYTEKQFVQDVGFDRGLSNGEEFLNVDDRFFTLSAGMNYQYFNRDKEVLRLGISWLEFNQPRTGTADFVHPSTFVIDASLLTRSTSRGDLLLSGYFSTSRKRHSLIPGVEYHYNTDGAIDNFIFLINASFDGYATAGIQLDHSRFRAGVSYDINLKSDQVVYNNTFEIAFQLKGVFGRQEKKSKRKVKQKSTKPSTTNIDKEKFEKQIKEEPADKDEIRQAEKDSSQTDEESLQKARVGQIKQQALFAEKSEYFFQFEHNSSELSADSNERLEILSSLMKEHPYLKIKLTGHTDDVGTKIYNYKLSLKRAQEVKSILLDLGIDDNRILIEGKGEEDPLLKNINDENRAKNRRVSLELDL